MLYLITGVPGSGKTLKMISDLMTREDLKNRPLYLEGIPEVKEDVIPHFPIPEGESMQTWHKWAPTGAILVIDECQRVFRPRPSGSKVPDYVVELETHRHKGIDIFLLTQHPRLIDANVRNLIGYHCHISITNLGFRRMVEWNACGDPQNRKSIAEGVKSVYTLDKRAFGVYKSAEEHTKINTRLSRVVYIFPVVLAAIIGAGYYLYSSWQTPDKAIKAAPVAQTAETLPPPYGGGSGTAVQEPQSSAEPQGVKTQAEQEAERKAAYLTEDDYRPRIEGRAETAPIYDGMNKAVKTMPYPVACVKSENRCTCYTEQATPIKDIPKSQCIDYVENGIYNPYKESNRLTTETTTPKAEAPQGGKVAVMGGKPQQNLMYDNWEERGRAFEGIGGGVVGGGT